MDLISLIGSRIGPMIGILLGRILNREQAYRLADWLADRVAMRKDAPAVRAVRANQAVVRGLPINSPKLDAAVQEVFRNAARGYADWYRAIAGGPEGVLRSSEIENNLLDLVREFQANDRGLIVAGVHMSSFNILLLALGVYKVPLQALSYHRVRGAIHVDNALRRRFGLNMTPISFEALRQAMDRLRQGGIVLTGVDRPDVGGDELTFFGRRVTLPVGHARLALQTNASILVGLTEQLGPGRYRGACADVIEPQKTSGDRRQDVRNLAQRVLTLFEEHIRTHPGEWLMFHPVWPDVFAQVRGD